jgi:hypothetical protein
MYQDDLDCNVLTAVSVIKNYRNSRFTKNGFYQFSLLLSNFYAFSSTLPVTTAASRERAIFAKHCVCKLYRVTLATIKMYSDVTSHPNGARNVLTPENKSESTVNVIRTVNKCIKISIDFSNVSSEARRD